jgi:hypothetical protein
MSSSDIKTKRITATGSLAVGPARIRQVQVLTNGVGAGRLTVTDGDGGSTVLDIDFLQSDSHSINIPDYGIRCESDVFVSTLTNITAVTVFYS